MPVLMMIRSAEDQRRDDTSREVYRKNVLIEVEKTLSHVVRTLNPIKWSSTQRTESFNEKQER